jgi:hypothetical protein
MNHTVSARSERDQLRTQLAEVTADRDRYRQSLPVEAQDYWYWRQRAETAEARVDVVADVLDAQAGNDDDRSAAVAYILDALILAGWQETVR